MPIPKGIRNLVIVNGLLSVWYAFNVVIAFQNRQTLSAVLQLLPLATFILAGPALLVRVPMIRTLARAFCYLASLAFSAIILLSLSRTGLWQPAAMVVVAIVLVVYLIGVRGYLNEEHVRIYFKGEEPDT